MEIPGNETVKQAMRDHRICVVIPTYNNAATLRSVISGVALRCNDIIVCDDGSTDATPGILRELSAAVEVISSPRNRGKGHALRLGLRRARERGFDYAITIDSDGQHYPDDLGAFVRAVINHPGSLIVGSRDLSAVAIDGKSSFANKFSNFWFAVQTGRRLKDTQTGYRAYPLRHIRGLRLLTNRYEAELELLVLAAWHGVEIIDIPIRVYYPPQGERVSHFRPALDFSRISLLNTILCFGAVIYGLPARIIAALRHRTIFRGELRPFTRRGGVRRDAAVTLGRILRSAYGLAFFLFWTAGVFTPFTRLYSMIGADTPSKRLRYHRLLRQCARLITRNFPGATTRYEISGKWPPERPAVIICNHQSHLDLPVIMSLHPRMVILTNDRVWRSKLYGHIIHYAGYQPVSAGLDTIMPRLRELRDRGYSIAVFPEGTRSADCRVLRFHQGAFHLAAALGMEIRPMVIHGAGHYLPKDDTLFRRGQITLRILPPQGVPRPDAATGSMRSTASACRRLIAGELDAIASTAERAAYFRSLVLYRYAWRGWAVVSECKRILRRLPRWHHVIDSETPGLRSVRIINSGCGTFALLYALVHRDTRVCAFEEDAGRHAVAAATTAPPNLRFIHATWPDDYETDGPFDKTILIADNLSGDAGRFSRFSPQTITLQ